MAVKKLKTDKEYNPQVLNDLIKGLATEKFMDNPHGFYVRGNNKDFRTLDLSEACEKLYSSGLDNLLLHARMATVGKETKQNIHGWNRQDWIFFHNGHFSGYAGWGKASDKSDSLLFFEEFLRKLNGNRKEASIADAIKTISNEKGFSGRAMLYDVKSDKMYLFGDFKLYFIDRQYLVFSSMTLDFSNVVTGENIHGFSFTRKLNSGLRVETKEVDGIGVIDKWSTENFNYKFIQSIKEYGYTYKPEGRRTWYDSRYGFSPEAPDYLKFEEQ